MDKRTAARLSREDTTPYLVEKPAAGGTTVRYKVTGYASAKVIAGRDPRATITQIRKR